MAHESIFRIAFVILLAALFAMRFYFMYRVRRSGGRLMPDRAAAEREGGPGMLVARIILFFLMLAFLTMYLIGMAWVDLFLFPLPGWLRWAGFGLGLFSVAFWT